MAKGVSDGYKCRRIFVKRNLNTEAHVLATDCTVCYLSVAY